MLTMLTIQDWLDAGYKRFQNAVFLKHSSFCLHKRFDDEKGKCYFIIVHVYEYDEKEFEIFPNMHKFTFEPDCQFIRENDITVNISLLLNKDSTIQNIEYLVHELWVSLGKHYYETWE